MAPEAKRLMESLYFFACKYLTKTKPNNSTSSDINKITTIQQLVFKSAISKTSKSC